MIEIGGERLYLPSEITEDMLAENERIRYNQKVYVIDWYCRDESKNDHQGYEVYDGSRLFTDNMLSIYILHGSPNFDDCDPIDAEINMGCNVIVGNHNGVSTFSWYTP
jgi:hypothetical protein